LNALRVISTNWRAMSGSARSGDMVIRLQIQRLEPLLGTASTYDGSELVFEGWMELIGAIAELLGGPDHAGVRAEPQKEVGTFDQHVR
jgi:hypothetical protein